MVELVPLRRNRDFVLLQTGQALSTVGSEAGAVAYTLLVLSLTHSPAKAGFVGFVRLAPWPLFALPAGVAVDRWNRKHLMILSDVVRVIAVGFLGVAILTGDVTFALITIVAFVEGTMYVLFNIAEIGAVRSVALRKRRPRSRGRCSVKSRIPWRPGPTPVKRELHAGNVTGGVVERSRHLAPRSRRAAR